jgi:hypothetical protein
MNDSKSDAIVPISYGEQVQPALVTPPAPTRAMRRVRELQIKGPRLNGRPPVPYRRSTEK